MRTAIEAVCIFDANMPGDALREHWGRVAPTFHLIFFHGRTFNGMPDDQVLEQAVQTAEMHLGIPCFFITKDQGFCEASGYDPQEHPIVVLTVTLTSRHSIPQFTEDVLRQIRSQLPPQ